MGVEGAGTFRIVFYGGGNSNMFYVHPYLGKMIPNLTSQHIVQMGGRLKPPTSYPFWESQKPFFGTQSHRGGSFESVAAADLEMFGDSFSKTHSTEKRGDPN